MKITGEQSGGGVQVDGKYTYYNKVPSNTPFCHVCRKRVTAVAEIVKGNPGNPKHACKPCLQKLLDGFEVVEVGNVRTKDGDS